MNKSSIKKRFARIAIAAGAVLLFIYAGRNCFAEIHRIADARIGDVLAIACIHLMTLWVTGITFKLGLEAYQEKITRSEGFALSTLAAYSNLFLPRAGLGVVAAYLKRTKNVSLTHFGCVILFNGALCLSTVATIGLVTLAFDPSLASPNTIWVGFALAAVSVSSLGATRIRIRVPASRQSRPFQLLRRFSEGSAKLGVGKFLVRLWIANAVMTLLRVWRLVFAFSALGLPVKWLAVSAASILGDLALLVSITPTGLGFREAAVASIANSIGVTASIAVSVALLDRLVFSITNVVAAQIILLNSWWNRNEDVTKSSDSVKSKVAFIATREPEYPRVSIFREQLRQRFVVSEYTSKATRYPHRLISVAAQIVWAKATGRLSQADVVVVGFFAQPIFPLVRLLYRGPIVADAFFSVFDTVVNDKALAKPSSVVGRLCYWLDRFMLRNAQLCFTDTKAHADYFSQAFHVPDAKLQRLWVSTEHRRLVTRKQCVNEGDQFEVIFWGNYIPLQGVETIVRAAHELVNEGFRFTLIGRGQTFDCVQKIAAERELGHVQFLDWMPPADIADRVRESHVALGIFGTTDKAARVIPNKAFEAIAMGVPLITRDSPAAAELLEHNVNCQLVQAGDPSELANRIRWTRNHYDAALEIADVGAEMFEVRCAPTAVGETMAASIAELIPSRDRTIVTQMTSETSVDDRRPNNASQKNTTDQRIPQSHA